VRPLRLVALRALDERGALYRQVGAALALAGVGVSSLWESHEQPIIRRIRAWDGASVVRCGSIISASGRFVSME
jgi:hypothetical protein